MSGFPWPLLISTLVLGIAYFIKHFVAHVVEDEHEFLWIIGAFLVIYAGAAIAMGYLTPPVNQIAAALGGNG